MPDRDARLAEAEQIVRARLDLQGTMMRFSTERTDDLWWLMVSPDVNAVRLVLLLLDAGAWRDDLPRLVRGALARQRRGAWGTTIANAWGALAVEKFSRRLRDDAGHRHDHRDARRRVAAPSTGRRRRRAARSPCRGRPRAPS